MTAARLLRRLAPVAAAALLAAAGAAARLKDGFDHREHAKLFTSCQTCHLGAERAGAAVFPAAKDCASCHDGERQTAKGKVLERVRWTPRTGPAPSNLRFTHDRHAREVIEKAGRDSALACQACHVEPGATWMDVKHAVVASCLDCHRLGPTHLAVADTACGTCHYPLWEAKDVPEAKLALWKAPPSHDAPDFRLEGHGRLAGPVTIGGKAFDVSPSCATCHAREYCANCHVNAPESKVIQALGSDRRALAMKVDTDLPEPASHKAAGFERAHGRQAQDRELRQKCMTCHTQETCLTCHLAPPAAVRLIAARAPDRAPGVKVERKRPVTHGKDFTDGHGALAAASSRSCAGCHVQEQCLSCHRPNAAAQAGYHPPDFLSRHPVAAYSRETSCADCHNTSQFCQTCHVRSGLQSQGILGTRGSFHDANPTFAFSHGPAARQNLESCTSCHAERDCLVCHSANGGRRFNPHGPGFDAARLLRKNPQMCTACHGAAIPGL